MGDRRIGVVIEVDEPQRRAAVELGLGIDRPDLAIPFRAPRTTVAAEHNKLGCARRARNQNENGQCGDCANSETDSKI
jgi:hypothetical protein